MNRPDCNHADMRRTDDAFECACGLVIERRPDRESYLAAARERLRAVSGPVCGSAAPKLSLVTNPSAGTPETVLGDSCSGTEPTDDDGNEIEYPTTITTEETP